MDFLKLTDREQDRLVGGDNDFTAKIQLFKGTHLLATEEIDGNDATDFDLVKDLIGYMAEVIYKDGEPYEDAKNEVVELVNQYYVGGLGYADIDFGQYTIYCTGY